MDTVIKCNKCKDDFTLNIEVKKTVIKKAGKFEEVIVQYFRCPYCGTEYVIMVQDEALRKLNDEYKNLLLNHNDMSLGKFKAVSDRMKNRIVAEESMLHHLYIKQKE